MVTVSDGTNIVTFNLTLIVYPNSRAANISTRARVLSGENVLIAGFIVDGPAGKMVFIRGLGPSLGVSGELSDPMIARTDSTGATIATNDNWSRIRRASCWTM